MTQKENMVDYQIKTRSEMKKIDVIFIQDDDIEEIILPKKDFDRQRTRLRHAKKVESADSDSQVKTQIRDKTKTVKRKIVENNEISNKKSKTNDEDDIELALAALENGEMIPVNEQKPTGLFDSEDSVEEKDIRSLTPSGEVSKEIKKSVSTKIPLQETPKTNKQIKVKLEETPSSSKASKSRLSDIKSCYTTPASPKRNVTKSFNRDNSTMETPKVEAVHNGKTPYTLRKRMAKDIKKIRQILEGSEEDFSGSDSEYENSDDNSPDEEIQEEVRSVRRKSVIHADTPKSRDKTVNDIKVTSDYFEKQSIKTKTSNNPFIKSKLTQEKIDEIYKNLKTNPEHEKSVKKLLKECSCLFEKWEFLFEQNYNILAYGIGSKKTILSQFSKRFSNKYPVVVVNGYFPNLTVKEIVENISSDILKINSSTNIHDTIELIEKAVKNIKIIVLIHNIDGLMLRNAKAQLVLSSLAKIDNIHVAASIDHINAPLLWDQTMMSEFNWVWWDCTSFLDYTEETVYESNILLQNTKGLTISSLRSVFNSLTKNSKSIFLIIVKYQLENTSTKNYTGITFKDLYRESRKELLITSDVALRSQLKEFLDHCILKQKRNLDSEECFLIAVDNKILNEFMEEQVTEGR